MLDCVGQSYGRGDMGLERDELAGA
jgi:hypothetical protein